MYLQIVNNIIKIKKLSRADLARLAGVSRAAVTMWFRKINKEGWVNVESQTLFRLAQGLKIPPEYLVRRAADLSQFEAEFIWDRLYPSMEDFVQALIQGRFPALARLVQLVGFYEASHIVGKKVIFLFDHYKPFIQPVRRKQLEVLWPLYRWKQ